MGRFDCCLPFCKLRNSNQVHQSPSLSLSLSLSHTHTLLSKMCLFHFLIYLIRPYDFVCVTWDDSLLWLIDALKSHICGNKWGEIIASAAQGAPTNRFVWICTLANPQWLGDNSDIQFESMVEHTNAINVVNLRNSSLNQSSFSQCILHYHLPFESIFCPSVGRVLIYLSYLPSFNLSCSIFEFHSGIAVNTLSSQGWSKNFET